MALFTLKCTIELTLILIMTRILDLNYVDIVGIRVIRVISAWRYTINHTFELESVFAILLINCTCSFALQHMF